MARGIPNHLPATKEGRFWRKVHMTDGCWLWVGALDTYGYGQLSWRGAKEQNIHRYAYEQMVGPIPEGLTMDHLCRTRNCVRPDHMEPVPHRVNVLRGAGLAAQQARQTHCRRGHPLEGENIYTQAGSRRRQCKTCARVNDRTRAAKRKLSRWVATGVR